MINKALPYYLEDRSGSYAGSDFDDIYDRLFLRVSRPPGSATDGPPNALMIYNVGRRSSNQRDYRPLQREPSVALEFGPSGTLGQISFMGTSVSMPMNQYLKKVSLFGGSLIRKFRASNGEEYKWTYKTESEHQWSCTDSGNYVVAHYNLKPPNKPAFRTSGNMLTINETHASLAIGELLASLTIMRHVAAYHL
ncbi:uncharacterized protein B0H18DRAFT_999323 [Fomitopsis serialis]|uniref:uncharacterized protein n=1 Tax=Fomitopsis serialis TaxID=139415 RepID=UPI00200782AA|nr:uncharacterized protein B0H18DRAFT_999323 [Neoantrodia serialis]KAH9928909.1 hypothetical protein B0H18DRAFT_999323 [Neoantrodia serialis]